MRRLARAIPLAAALALAFQVGEARAQFGRGQDAKSMIGADEGNYYDTPSQTRGLDVVENIGRTLPLDMTFTDHEGKVVRLGDYFKNDGRPVVITLVYYNCPIVCDVMLVKQTEVFDKLDYTVGKEFLALAFSFDPREDAARARTARDVYTAPYRRLNEPGVDAGWRFHVGEESNTRLLADALGFQYRRLGDGNFSHPVCQFVITPDGRVSRYLYGYPSDPRDLKLALMDASEGKLVRTIGERFLSFCYTFDASAGKYSLQVYRVLQIGAGVTLVTLGGVIGAFMIGERLRRRRAARGPAATPHASQDAGPTGPAHATG